MPVFPSPTGAKSAAMPYGQCPAKTYMTSTGETVPGRDVLEHCTIVGTVAKNLIALYPPMIRERLFPPNVEFSAAAHDLGKVSPTFVEKLRRACHLGYNSHPALYGINPALESEWGGHAGVSQATAALLDAPEYVPEILGQHHGFSPPVGARRGDADAFGGQVWFEERVALLHALKRELQADWPTLTNAAQARIAAGLTSVADWIGSGRFFEDPQLDWKPRVERALQDAGFLAPVVVPNLSFEDVFGFSPLPTQERLIDAVQSPGVYLLEAPMGLGKTEAALFAAYQAMASGRATGIYFALPTQLTSNRIYDRFTAFLERIVPSNALNRPLLLHGGAWLLESAEMGEEGRPGGTWFHSAKRGLLAPYAVGTIDQALMAVMNVKHGFVRAFGLAGKVVVLDEVHTYDAYTGSLLDALIAFLREAECTVIVLSATLSRARRQPWVLTDLQLDDYPLITASPNQGLQREVSAPPPRGQTVAIRRVPQPNDALREALQRAADGQQVLWIENTVAEAQERYLDLAARAREVGCEIGLLHSRFIATDRAQQEDRWVALFGKAGWPLRGTSGRILVGTQVLEQSLDIDADFLVTRIAPTDMVLQRLGRLWRHAAAPRHPQACCEAWILAPELTQAIHHPRAAFGATAAVYSPYVLCRSLEAWQKQDRVCLPDDIRPLINATYDDRPEQGPMAQWRHELHEGTRNRKGLNALQSLARLALAQGGRTLSDQNAATRYSDTDSVELLILRSLRRHCVARITRLTLMNGERLDLPWDRHRLQREDWRRLSAKLMTQIVKVAIVQQPEPAPLKELHDLGFGHALYVGSPEWDEAILRVVFCEPDGTLCGWDGGPAHASARLEYRSDLGYRFIPFKEP